MAIGTEVRGNRVFDTDLQNVVKHPVLPDAASRAKLNEHGAGCGPAPTGLSQTADGPFRALNRPNVRATIRFKDASTTHGWRFRRPVPGGDCWEP